MIGGFILGGLRGLSGFEGAKLTNMPNFRTFLNWYLICYKIFALFSNGTIFVSFFSHFALIGSTVFKATFCICTFWRQKVKKGLKIGNRGFNFEGVYEGSPPPQINVI